MKPLTEVLAAEAPHGGRRRSWPRRLWLLVAVVVIVAVVAAVAVVRERRQDQTAASWSFVTAAATRLAAQPGWEFGRSWPPCSNADPAAFIELSHRGGVEDSKTWTFGLANFLAEEGWTVNSPLETEPISTLTASALE